MAYFPRYLCSWIHTTRYSMDFLWTSMDFEHKTKSCHYYHILYFSYRVQQRQILPVHIFCPSYVTLILDDSDHVGCECIKIGSCIINKYSLCLNNQQMNIHVFLRRSQVKIAKQCQVLHVSYRLTCMYFRQLACYMEAAASTCVIILKGKSKTVQHQQFYVCMSSHVTQPWC